MVVIKLTDGKAWLWSPIEYSDELATEIEITCGPIAHLVSPNRIHWLFLKAWQEQRPSAATYASPGLAERKIAKDLRFKATLGDEPDASYSRDIDQVIFYGSKMLDEVVFFHRSSQTVLFCDLIQRFPAGWKGWAMRTDGLNVGNSSTPRELRFLFWWNGGMHLAREALDKVLHEWSPAKLIVAHGECAEEGAATIIEKGFYWVPEDARPRESCCCTRIGRVNDGEESKKDE